KKAYAERRLLHLTAERCKNHGTAERITAALSGAESGAISKPDFNASNLTVRVLIIHHNSAARSKVAALMLEDCSLAVFIKLSQTGDNIKPLEAIRGLDARDCG
ncbi:MAG: hypothetical protein MMC33_010438, partial [Icmadophila ericetorum]|nr:hypothetical protein [Icmadophila ericetorum]